MTDPESFHTTVFETSCSDEFLEAWNQRFKMMLPLIRKKLFFSKAGIHFIPPPLREDPAIIEKAMQKRHSLP